MTATPTAPPSRAKRSEAQWALGETEPVNPNEVFKQEDPALNVQARIIDVYSKQGFDAITKDDLRGRFRWMGLYTQREQGYDGTFTGDENADLLEAKYFMMRVRCDGKALSAAAMRTLGQISVDFARNTADISDRQNVQYHWIEIEKVPEIWDRLAEVGLQTIEACGDCPRAMLGSPLAGESLDEVLDPSSALDEIVRRYIGNPEFANLPRKFKSAITGHPSLDVVHEINDISLVGVHHPELGPGYDLWVGGGLSTAPRLAERLGAFVPPERAAEVWHGVIRLFRDYGFRRLRTKARLKFLLADWGTERFREVLETEYLDAPLPDGPPPATPTGPADHVGVQRQKDGRYAVGAAPVVGRVGGPVLGGLADLLDDLGGGRIALTPHQKLVVLDVPEDRVEEVEQRLEALGLSTRPTPFRRATMACTGIEFCKLAIVDTKDTAAATIAELETRLLDVALDRPISLNLNGCPNSCARIQVADIGLKGQLVPGPDGENVPGFQVHLGGGLAGQDLADGELGRTVRGLKVTADELTDYVERVTRRFVTDRDEGESFAHWAHRADEEALS